MKKKISYLVYSLLAVYLIAACTKDTLDADRFKYGVFEIPAGESYGKTIITRKDSLQIEAYEKIISVSNDSAVVEKKIKRIDTLYITWKNNFFYTLKMKSPKKKIDKDPIFVQITEVKDSSYNFSARVGFSKFLTKGIIYKVN